MLIVKNMENAKREELKKPIIMPPRGNHRGHSGGIFS